MAITKVSQLVQIKNSNAVLALTNRSFDAHGNILNAEDLLELSVRRKTVGQSSLNTNYYSFSSSIADLQFAIAGKLYNKSANDADEILTPALMYNSKFGSRYKKDDRILYIGNDGNTYVLRRTNQGAFASAPTSDTIAPAGTPDSRLANNHYWKYENADFSKHMIPLFTQIQTIGKITNGYWAESIPFTPIDGMTYYGAYEVLKNTVLTNEFVTAYTTEENERVGEIQRINSDRLTLQSVITLTNLSNSYIPAMLNQLGDIATNAGKLLAIYDASTDRYILSAHPTAIQNLPETLYKIAKVFGTVDYKNGIAPNSSNNIYFPFFVLREYTNGEDVAADLYLPYTPEYINGMYSTDVVAKLGNDTLKDVVYGNGIKNTPIGLRSHLYYFLGNNFRSNTEEDDAYISVLSAARCINNKENLLKSNTLALHRKYIESHNVLANGDKNPTTQIELKIFNPSNTPLSLTNYDDGLKFLFGDSLSCVNNRLHYSQTVGRKRANSIIPGTVYEIEFTQKVATYGNRTFNFSGVMAPVSVEGGTTLQFIAGSNSYGQHATAFGIYDANKIIELYTILEQSMPEPDFDNSYSFERYFMSQGSSTYTKWTYKNNTYEKGTASYSNVIQDLAIYSNSNVANNFTIPFVNSVYRAYCGLFNQTLAIRRIISDEVNILNTKIEEVESLVRYNSNRLHSILYVSKDLPLK